MSRSRATVRTLAQAQPGPYGASGAGFASARAFFEAPAAWLADALAREAHAQRLFLWLPVLMGVGVLAWFAAEREPALWPAPMLALVLSGLAWRAYRAERIGAGRALLAAAFLFAGFAAAAIGARLAAAPVLERPVSARAAAFVESVDLREGGARLLLRVVSVEGLSPERTPARVRVTMRGRPAFEAGATIAATLRLSPPPTASVPNGYDFARDAWFRRIGAVGFVTGRIEMAAPAAVPLAASVGAAIDRARNNLTERIVDAIGGAKGAVAAALVTGKRGLIPEETNEALRAAGVYHVVSISGLHMVLAAGIFLWIMRAALALAPAIALRRPIKKWAAAFAMCGAFAYNLFSGSEVATERAMIMTLVMLGAVLFDRPAISMRNLAIAAIIVMARDPSAVLGPSFQMSFGAVAAMIAIYERAAGAQETRARGDAPPSLMQRGIFILGAMMATTLVASIATDPYGAYHFNRIAMYGLIGNALALPLVEFVVMPAAAFGLIASLFGLDAPIWWVMGHGVGFMLDVSHWVAGLPGAVRRIPSFGVGALLLLSLALVWMTLWRKSLRWFGLVFAAAGIVLAARAPQPDILIDAGAQTLAYRGADGRLHAFGRSRSAFTLAQWLGGDADSRNPRALGAPLDGRCDPSGCVARLQDGRTLAFVMERVALAEDCARADILVTRLYVPESCKAPKLVLDGAHFAAHGATRMFVEGERFRLHTARTAARDRPWSRAPRVVPEGADSDDDPAVDSRLQDAAPERLD